MIIIKVYTKTGDNGQTSLIDGSRIKKSDIRIVTYGTIDEANSVLGIARTVIKDEEIKEIILKIQKELFQIGAELASIGTKDYKYRIDECNIKFLELIIDKYEELTNLPNGFIVPGGNFASSQLDVARTIIRRAERYATLINEKFNMNANLIKYINRLSDMIYTFARYLDFKNIINVVNTNIENKKSEKKIRKENINLENNKLDKVLNINRKVARIIVDACIEKAEKIQVPMVICITDVSGNIIVLEKMDNALIASIDIAKDKAYTSCIFKLPTSNLQNLSIPSGELFGINNMKNVITFGGGIPLEIKGNIIGAIGVSGGTVQQDILVAEHGVKILKGGI